MVSEQGYFPTNWRSGQGNKPRHDVKSSYMQSREIKLFWQVGYDTSEQSSG